MTISQSNAEQIGVILETMAYGVYLAIFVQCLNVLRKRHAYQKPASYLLITAVTLFVLVTMHLTMDLVRSMEATQTNSARGAELYYEDLATWKNVFKTGCYVAATVVSDAFILYRCFVVWGRNYFIVVIPILLFIADVVSGVLFCTTLNKANKNLNFAELEMALQFYSITLTLNSMCTLLIAWRIWKLQKTLAPYSTFDRELKRVAVLIVESGAVYSAWLFIQIGTYAGHSPAMFIFLNSMSPIIGIVFSAVIVRIGLGLSAGDDRPLHASTRDMRFTTHTGGAGAGGGGGGGGADGLALQVELGLARAAHSGTEGDDDAGSTLSRGDGGAGGAGDAGDGKRVRRGGGRVNVELSAGPGALAPLFSPV